MNSRKAQNEIKKNTITVASRDAGPSRKAAARIVHINHQARIRRLKASTSAGLMPMSDEYLSRCPTVVATPKIASTPPTRNKVLGSNIQCFLRRYLESAARPWREFTRFTGP